MSNIYIQEPSTSGKVVFTTTVGEIDIELWTRECPLTCRNFIQLCLEGYYNGTFFHRVVKDFIVQGGDPNGDGTGGESIYGNPFKDEFHSRLRYTRRGLVGMANSDKDDNGSQFFFTMGPTPELQNKNTLFGKVTGDTIFNMLKLQEGLVDQNERPMYPQKIIRTEVLNNPFGDIKPRMKRIEEKKEKRKTVAEKGVKNFGLLSFGVEAEQDEEQTIEFVQKNTLKAKSQYDVANCQDPINEVFSANTEAIQTDLNLQNTEENETDDETLLRVQKKLRHMKSKRKNSKEGSDSDRDDILLTYKEGNQINKEKMKQNLRKEINALKREYHSKRKRENEDSTKANNLEKLNDVRDKAADNFLINNYLEERQKHKELRSKIPLKGASREEFTLSLLSKFRAKLNNIKEREFPSSDAINEEDVDTELRSDEWMAHKLKFNDDRAVLAKDASTKSDDWYDVYDPRNPINKRKRNAKTLSEEKRN